MAAALFKIIDLVRKETTELLARCRSLIRLSWATTFGSRPPKEPPDKFALRASQLGIEGASPD
jgi:hypothetical protein